LTPLTSLQDDVAATKRILDLQLGPCILVAHSYGGTVITEAGTDPHVVGLVYIAALSAPRDTGFARPERQYSVADVPVSQSRDGRDEADVGLGVTGRRALRLR